MGFVGPGAAEQEVETRRGVAVILLAVLLQLGATPLQTLSLEHLELDAPAGVSLEKQEGTDFAVYRLRSPNNTWGLGVYLGNHPSRSAIPKGVTHEPLQLGRWRMKWSCWDTEEAEGRILHAAVIAEQPFGNEPPYSIYLHLFIDAKSAAALKEAQGIAATLRPATPSKPKASPGASVLPNKGLKLTSSAALEWTRLAG